MVFYSRIDRTRTSTIGAGKADMQRVSSWGRLGLVPHEITRPAFLDEARDAVQSPGRARLCFGLGRSTGDVLTLSRTKNSELFAATIGGLGLTGMILWVELQLTPIRSAMIDSETLPLKDLADFFRVSEEGEEWPYRVAWIDCLAKASAAGRGFYIRGRHADSGGLAVHRVSRIAAPFDAPGWLLNAHSINLFNTAYRHRPFVLGAKRLHYDPFFFPLDAVANWNRLYGKRGFFQHQSLIPMAGAFDALRKLLALTAEFGEGSFLVVLKLFGDKPSPGFMSFPRPGATLALDFSNKGDS